MSGMVSSRQSDKYRECLIFKFVVESEKQEEELTTQPGRAVI